MSLNRVMRWLRNSPNWILVISGLFLFLVLFQRIILPSFSNRAEELLSRFLRFDLPFDISVVIFSIIIFIIWSSLKQNFADQADEVDQLKASNRALTEEVERLSKEYFRDDITKIPNEIKLNSVFRKFLEEHPYRGFSLIYFDVDSFKRLNSTLGTAKANIILRALAWKLRSGIRREEEIFRDQSSDLFRRFVGGDEFILLIHGDEQTCIFFMKRVLSEVLPELSAELREKLSLEDGFSLSISAGSYTYSPSEKRQLIAEDKGDLKDILYKIIADAERLCQSAKNNDYGVCYVWNGLVSALPEEPKRYEKFISFFPHKQNN